MADAVEHSFPTGPLVPIQQANTTHDVADDCLFIYSLPNPRSEHTETAANVSCLACPHSPREVRARKVQASRPRAHKAQLSPSLAMGKRIHSRTDK